MRFLLEGEIKITERKAWQEDETRRRVLLASIQQPKRGSLVAHLGSRLVMWGLWMQHIRSEAA